MEVSKLSDFSRVSDLLSERTKLYEKMDARAPYTSQTNREQMRARAPMIMTNSRWLESGGDNAGRYIMFWCNPSNAVWNFQIRGVEQQIRTGHIMHYWRDYKRTTYWDNPTINFTFQSGNMLPVRMINTANTINGDQTLFLPPGLLDYYDFFTLLDDHPILADGRPNLIYIVYHSLVYPSIVLYGHFLPDTITMTDSAEAPDGITWSATFRVTGSNPSLHDRSALKLSWQSQFNQNNITTTG